MEKQMYYFFSEHAVHQPTLQWFLFIMWLWFYLKITDVIIDLQVLDNCLCSWWYCTDATAKSSPLACWNIEALGIMAFVAVQ